MNIGVKPARDWKEWEGQIVDGKFRLLRYLGSTERSAVFQTERPQGEPRKAAIKLVALRDDKAAMLLSRWKASALLLHPRFVRLFEMGRAKLGDLSCAYVLMEYAEEDLSSVGRPLTPTETNDLHGAVVKGLTYLHRKGLAHGHLRTSNILAVGDQIKISSDSIRPVGEWLSGLDFADELSPPEMEDEGATAAGDVWSLGITLVNGVTLQSPSWQPGSGAVSLPENLPVRLRAPVAACLHRDPKKRLTLPNLAALLQPGPQPLPTPQYQAPSAKTTPRTYLLPAGAIALTLVLAVLGVRFLGHRAAPPRVVESARPQFEPPIQPAPPEEIPRNPIVKGPQSDTAGPEILNQVLPKVPVKASNTIHGKVVVRIRVAVNTDGSVVDAKNETPEASRYFVNLALQAARQWKFRPAGPSGVAGSQEWILRFQFVRDANDAVSVQTKRYK